MLKTTVERLEGNSAKLTVTVSSDEVDAAVAAAYSKLGSKLRIPGFRKGKAPRPVVDNYVGRDYVLAEATEELVNTTYPRALDAENLRTVEAPEMEELPTVLLGEEYTYEAEVELRPELELTSMDTITVELPPREVTDKEIDDQIDVLRERFATLEPVEDRGIEEKDYSLISFVGYVDGETYEGNVVDKYLYEMGRGLMPAPFDEALMGMTAGDEKRVEFEIPDTSSNPEYVGKMAQFDLTVHEIKARILPPVDDALAAEMGFDTVDQMRADIQDRLTLQKTFAFDQAKEKASREELARRLPGDIPAAMISGRKASLQEDYARRLEDSGLSLEAYAEMSGMTREVFEENLAREAEGQIREDLALEALFRALDMEVTDEDLDKEMEQMAQASKSSVEEARKKWQDMGLMPVIRESVIHRKAVGWLMENVEVVEVEPGAESEGEPVEAGTKKPAKKRAPKKAAKPKATDEPAEEPAETADSPESTEE